MKDIYVVAHTQSQHHVDEVVGGWFDTGLTDLGRRQAAAAAARLKDWIGEGAPRIVSSDLKRAAETADVISRAFGAPVALDADLREMSYGSAGGKPDAWMRENESYSPRIGDRMGHRSIPDGESKREFATRIYRAMDRIVADPAPVQVVVTHGFSITFVVAAWVGMPLEATGYINLRTNSGGLTHLREDDVRFNRAVVRLNEVAHLEGLK
ncbi:MAG: histidine phosphatase family protein [Caulobacteraceae bacterium]|nr:histidine phosphatase family protein [Caulobacteraceae bacterium]